MTPPLGVSIDVLQALCADPRFGAPLLEVADPEAAKMLRSLDVSQLRALCEQHKIGPPQSMLKSHGANYPRGRDNFEWTGGARAEPLDLEAPEPWIAALLQPLVTTAQVCEYMVLRDTERRREAYIDRLRRLHWCANHSAGGSAAGRRAPQQYRRHVAKRHLVAGLRGILRFAHPMGGQWHHAHSAH